MRIQAHATMNVLSITLILLTVVSAGTSQLVALLDEMELLPQTGRLNSTLQTHLPLTSGVFCDEKVDPVEYTSFNVTVRQCRVNNLCWNLKERRLENSHLLQEGSRFPVTDEAFFAHMNGMRNNLAYVWFPHIFPRSLPEDAMIALITEPTLIMKRYLSLNTMHTFHDEFLPGLAAILHHPRLLRGRNRLVVTTDDSVSSPNDAFMSWLGQHWSLDHLQAALRYKHGRRPDYICFEEAYIGLDSKRTSWYQYGFERPQGPILSIDRAEVGGNVRAMTAWLTRQLHIDTSKVTRSALRKTFSAWRTGSARSDTAYISVLSRTLTRLILNEDELVRALETAFPGVRVLLLRMEELEIEEIVEWTSRSVALIGMHGALMAVGAFLPPGAVLVELFPFGIPAENYTPYKTMAELPGMDIAYRAWVNPHEGPAFNVGHPDRHFTAGGLGHFPASYADGILATKTVPEHKCCYSPFWIYRIFQDTRVDCEQIVALMRSAMSEVDGE